MRLKDLGEKVDEEEDDDDDEDEASHEEEAAALNGDRAELRSKEIIDSNEQKVGHCEPPRSESPRGELELNIDEALIE